MKVLDSESKIMQIYRFKHHCPKWSESVAFFVLTVSQFQNDQLKLDRYKQRGSDFFKCANIWV